MLKRALASVLLALPVVTVGLWLASGRETLTKSAKAVQVPVKDELFGEAFTQDKIEMVRGPILGYYVGLDLVIVVTLACLVVGIISWLAWRHHARTLARRSMS